MARKTNRNRESHSVTIEPSIWAALVQLSAAEDRSVSNLINLFCREGLAARGLLPKDTKK